MNEVIVVVVFVMWYTLSLLISELIAKKRKIGTEWSFFFCMVLSPVVGVIITLSSKKLLKQPIL